MKGSCGTACCTRANWVDQDVVIDGNLITSRKPADLDVVCDALLKKL
jgi:protease I